MELDSRPATGGRALLVAASVVIVIAGLKAASGILVPIILAALVAALCMSPMRFLQRKGVPDWASLPLLFLVIIGAVVGCATLVGNEVAYFRGQLGTYREQLDAEWRGQIDAGLRWLESVTNSDMSTDALKLQLQEVLDFRKLVDTMGAAVGAFADILSQTLFVLLTVLFILAEAAGFPKKLGEAFSESIGGVDEARRAVTSIHDYVRIKTELSVATGLLAFFLCAAVGVDSAVLWGVLAFALNYVPTVGSLVAALPPILLAFVQLGWQEALIVLIGYFVINMVIGNVLEPRLMGRKLGLSALVVFLSLVFWGWVWGPVGMLLSVPLTMVVKILLEQSDDLRWLAILLGPGGEKLVLPETSDLALATQTVEVGRIEIPSVMLDAPASEAPLDEPPGAGDPGSEGGLEID